MTKNLKPTKRKAFNFLRSYFDVLNELQDNDDKLNFLLAIINKQFLDEDPKDINFIVNICYESQRHSVESSVKGYKDKTKQDLMGNPITPPCQGGMEGGSQAPIVAPCQQEKEKEKEKEEVKEKVKEIKKEKINFIDLVKNEHIEKYGQDFIDLFSAYWTQKQGSKIRYEKEATFDISRRMATFATRHLFSNEINAKNLIMDRNKKNEFGKVFDVAKYESAVAKFTNDVRLGLEPVTYSDFVGHFFNWVKKLKRGQ